MTRTVRLRRWQKAALDQFVAAPKPDFLAVATPGAGKTTFALTAARHQLAERPGRLVVVAPTAHLKIQWARAAARVLAPPRPGVVGRRTARCPPTCTASSPPTSRSRRAPTLLSPARARRVRRPRRAPPRRRRPRLGRRDPAGVRRARRRLALSGTPFRSDTRAIPFVAYDGDEAVPDFEYGYGDALADRRVVRPVYFPRTNGHMEWTAPDGSVHAATFDDPLDAARAGQRLRTALSLDGEWLPTVLRAAHERLTRCAPSSPTPAGW